MRERNQTLVRLAKERVRRSEGRILCMPCGFCFQDRYGSIGEDYIEAQHTKPILEMSDYEETRMDDIALVCSNCHRMLHRRRPWLSLGELRDLLLII